MSSKEAVKQAVCDAIEAEKDRIIALGETILKNPETGFNEFKTAKLVAATMEELGLRPQTGLAITGVKGRLESGKDGPTLALMGELDSLKVDGHPFQDKESGASHACGHNAQVAGMLGAALGIQAANAGAHLAGKLVFMAVPAEELIEVEDRMRKKAEGKLEFLTGKAELIRLDHFDDVDMAMMFHTKSEEGISHMADTSNGSLVKKIRFIGKAAHAGGRPQLGINALNAASLALTAIAYQRETFWDDDTIRIHPIITKGGEAVSVVPSDVRMETFIRGKTLEGIVDANRKVDRALRGAALAIGAEVEIETTPGYLPQHNNNAMAGFWGNNVETLFGPDQFYIGEHRTGSTDMGDVGHIMPVIHPYINGATGVGHGKDYILEDKQRVYVDSAKLLAMTAIDLLWDDAAEASRILNGSKPKMTKQEYLAFQRALNNKEHFQAEAASALT